MLEYLLKNLLLSKEKEKLELSSFSCKDVDNELKDFNDSNLDKIKSDTSPQ